MTTVPRLNEQSTLLWELSTGSGERGSKLPETVIFASCGGYGEWTCRRNNLFRPS